MSKFDTSLKFNPKNGQAFALYEIKNYFDEIFKELQAETKSQYKETTHNFKIVKLCFALGYYNQDFSKIILCKEPVNIINPIFEIPESILNTNGFYELFLFLECLYNDSITDKKHLYSLYNFTKPTEFVIGYEKFQEFVTKGAFYIVDAKNNTDSDKLQFLKLMAHKYYENEMDFDLSDFPEEIFFNA